MTDMDENSPVFAIAVAAELAEMHPQTLRQYDRLGLVVPGRTRGGSRRYSMRDVVQLREIGRLGSEGVSLEGDPPRARPREREPGAARPGPGTRDGPGGPAHQPTGARVFAATATGAAVSLRAGARPQRNTQIVLWRPPN